jgi:hypothetical protein
MSKLTLRQLGVSLSISLILVLCFAIGSYAVQSAGNKEIQLSGGFFHANDTDVGTVTLDASYGYYLTNVWQIGVGQTLNYNINDNASDTWTASTIPFVHYHIRGLSTNDTFQPFLGAFAGAVYNDDDATGTAGPAAGFKAFMNETTFLVTKYRYEWFFNDVELGDVTDTTRGNHIVTLGLGFVF